MAPGGRLRRTTGREGVGHARVRKRPPFPSRTIPLRRRPAVRQGLLSQRLAGHDVILVIGAAVFRYYPWVAGDYVPDGRVCCTSPPILRSQGGPVGDSLVGDAVLALGR